MRSPINANRFLTATWFAILIILTAAAIAHGDEPNVRRITDPNHLKMLAWKVDYVLPDDTGKPQIDLDYDYWDPKVEGDAFSKKSLNSAKIAGEPGGAVSFEVLLSAKESLIIFNGKEYHGKGTPLAAKTQTNRR